MLSPLRSHGQSCRQGSCASSRTTPVPGTAAPTPAKAAPVPAGIPSPRPRGLVSRQSAGASLLLLVRLFLCHSPYAHIAETLEDTLCPPCCLRDLWC